MTHQEQTVFINELIKNVQGDIIKESNKYPEAWNGIELRWRIADVFNRVVFGEIGKRSGKRYRDYHNTVIVKNMI